MARVGFIMLAVIALGSGCGPRLRAVPSADQKVRLRDGTATRRTPQVEMEARPVELSWAARQSLIAFHVSIRNVSDTALVWAPADLLLEDAEGRLRRPLPMDALIRSYRAAGKRGPLPAALRTTPAPGPPFHQADPHAAHACPPGGRVVRASGAPPALSQYGLTGRPSPYEDPLWPGQRASTFLMQTPQPREVAPGACVCGCIVFACPLEPGAQMTLSLPRHDTSLPATAPDSLQMRFDYR